MSKIRRVFSKFKTKSGSEIIQSSNSELFDLDKEKDNKLSLYQKLYDKPNSLQFHRVDGSSGSPFLFLNLRRSCLRTSSLRCGQMWVDHTALLDDCFVLHGYFDDNLSWKFYISKNSGKYIEFTGVFVVEDSSNEEKVEVVLYSK
nr:hypothetical protein pmam_170 [Pithovirus mammoth]